MSFDPRPLYTKTPLDTLFRTDVDLLTPAVTATGIGKGITGFDNWLACRLAAGLDPANRAADRARTRDRLTRLSLTQQAELVREFGQTAP